MVHLGTNSNSCLILNLAGNTLWGSLLDRILGKRHEDRLWQRWCSLVSMVQGFGLGSIAGHSESIVMGMGKD